MSRRLGFTAACVLVTPLPAVAAAPIGTNTTVVVVARGETVGQIVDRLVPGDRDRYQRVLREVLRINAHRFPAGRADRVGEGFRLLLPAGTANAAGDPAQGTKSGGNIPAAATLQVRLGDSLQSLADAWFPEQPIFAADAVRDLIKSNPGLPPLIRQRPTTPLPVATVLRLPAWIATVHSTPLPTNLSRKDLLEGVFVPAVWTGDAATPKSALSPNLESQSVASTRVRDDATKSTSRALRDDRDIVVAQVSTLDRFEAEQERLRKLLQDKPKAYEDRVLDATPLPTLPNDDAPATTADGYRAWFGETRVGQARSAGARATDVGMRAEYRQETLNHGEWVAQVDARSRTGSADIAVGALSTGTTPRAVRATLRNLGYPVTTQLFADTTLGDQVGEVTDALSRGYRAAISAASYVRGLSTHWFARDLDVRAGIGARGSLLGGPFPGFERSSGDLAWFGATRRFDGGAYAGAQITRASGIPDTLRVGKSVTVDAVAAAAGFGGDLVDADSRRARLTAVASRTSTPLGTASAHAFGVFAEGGARIGAFRNEAGVYWTQPNLRFADIAMQSDNRGAFWRVDHRGGRLFWGMGLDFDETNPTHRPGIVSQRRFGSNANAQYRIDRSSSIGGNLSFVDTRYNAPATSIDAPAAGDGHSGSRSTSASAFYQTRVMSEWGDLGRSRITLSSRHNETLVANGTPATGQELQWEHDWITGKYETMRPELVTTLGWARDQSAGHTQTYPTAGVQWKYWPDGDFWIGGNLRYTSRRGNLATSRGLSGTVNAERVLVGSGGAGSAGTWRLGLQASINEARVENNAIVGLPPLVTRSSDKWGMLYVRFEDASGNTFQALGLRSAGSAGSGSIRGIVYFDANRDGAQQADERGAPGVEVELDGRYRVTTDRDGRFEFPIVPTGNHRITLRLDTVPLPWAAALERGLEVHVPLRGAVDAPIPVVKTSE